MAVKIIGHGVSLGALAFAAGLLSGCAQDNNFLLPPTMNVEHKAGTFHDLSSEDGAIIQPGAEGAKGPNTLITRPGAAVPEFSGEKSQRAPGAPPLKGPPRSLALEQVPLPAFIDTVFGQLLGLTYQVDPQIAQRQELVTLRIPEERKPAEVLTIVQEVLKTYGARVTFEGNVARIVPDQVLAQQVPQIIRGRASRDVATDMRPVFQIIPLTSVLPVDMQSWIGTALGTKVKVTGGGSMGNVVMLFGLPDDVSSAIDAVRVLDQPRMAGRQSLAIEPVFWSVERLAKKLIEILKSEGYPASVGLEPVSTISLIPVEPSNSLLIFAPDVAAAKHIQSWAQELDRPAKADPTKTTFIYGVKNTTASSLADVLGNLFSGAGGAGGDQGGAVRSPQQPTSQIPSLNQGGLNSTLPGQSGSGLSGGGATMTGVGVGSGAASGSTVRAVSTGQGGGRLVIDEARNGIIFMGSAEEWAKLLPVIEKLDRAPLETLIEVTIVEVTLTNQNDFGIEWSLRNRYSGVGQGVGGTLGGLGVTPGSSTVPSPGGGLSYTIFNAAGVVRDALNALSTDNRVNVKSTPRIVTRSGTEASIQVGDQVPIVTSQATSPIQTGGTTSLLNSVSYQQTGTILKVKPTVYAGNRVDLVVAQEVSVPAGTTTSSISSPTISTRAVQTTLSLKDGATVMLGGLIQENRENDNTGVPFLSDIPGLGLLFKKQHTLTTKTELLIFITPYAIRSNEDAERITDELKRSMDDWPRATGRLNY